ncbi:transketolase [Hydrogenophilus thermoluteolus]|uniref:Transketolase n=3 Tax=Hydrogenophilus thermoluteolus TaxID=297 RepID=A0A2Z6DX84_HYDTE|nr:transketolase [Hydrogenophilus thermoluteolus]
MTEPIQTQMANALRFLAVDATNAANSGHPGAPLGMAEMAVALWRDHLRVAPQAPTWPNRDRFVLSNGHASMLIYALLHLTGFDLPLDELKRFRQLGSKTAGHPEYGHTPGVETTTGPLGQGFANAVGMALAEKLLAAEFNTPEHPLIDHFTYVFLGDGCLMEGISHEAASLAGTLRLSKLICLYDDNGISIDGAVSDWFSDDTAQRFAAYHWNVIGPIDGHDVAAVSAAIAQAKAQAATPDGKPTLIICRTTIGKGSPVKEGTCDIHGAPIGTEAAAKMREALGWPYAPFEIPEAIYAAWDKRAQGETLVAEWEAQLAAYCAAYPEKGSELKRRLAGELPADWKDIKARLFAAAAADEGNPATRKASQNALNVLGPAVPELFGGSADLTHSNLTDFKGATPVRRDQFGRHLSYGVREFAMAAIMNGIALHKGLIPYGGTFLVFSDYARNAIRMAALMQQRVVHVLTHDSIGLGEDGPTHQPVEHIPSLRLIPNLDVWRPADALETAVAWTAAIERADGPTALVLSRQNLPKIHTDPGKASEIACGGYVVAEHGTPQIVFIATGSEVSLALQAAERLAEMMVGSRVVSIPCVERFAAQPEHYRASILPEGLPKVAIEAAHPDLWYRWVGANGAVIGIDRFGESAPANELFAHFGFTVERVVATAQALLGR